MNKSLKSRKSKDKIENKNLFEVIDPNDSLGNLLIASEKLKCSLYQQKFKSPTISLTTNVFSCVNNVLLEYGEESIKRQRYKNDPIECRDKYESNKKWTNCIKVLEELITIDRGLDRELYGSILILIAQVHERQSLRIVNSTVLHQIINNWVAHIEHVDPSLTQQYMRCLASFILGNLTDIPKEMFSLLSGAFFRASERYLEIVEPDTETMETLKYCVSGLTNLCYLAPSSDGLEMDDFLAKRFQTCGRFFQLFVLCLERLPLLTGLSQVSLFRMQHQCLHGLNYVSQRPHGLSLDNTERLLAVLRVYCGFGMFRIIGDVSTTVTTDADDLGHVHAGELGEHCNVRAGELGEHGPTRSNYRNANGSDTCSYSRVYDCGESGECDADDESNINVYRPMRKWEVKTRRLSLELLLKVLAKSWRKVSAIVWSSFMPATARDSRRRFHLLNVLDRERDGAVKGLVVRAIHECVLNCRDLLASAQHQAVPANFVSRSHNLACVIEDAHNRVLSSLANDRSVPIRIQCLHCLLALIRTVPYHRLRPSIVHSLVYGLRHCLLESRVDQSELRCVVLDCLASLVGFESVSGEMRHLLLAPSVRSLFFGGGDADSHCTQPSWLVQLCVRLAHPTVVAQLWTGALSSESWSDSMDPVVAKVVAEGDSGATDTSVRCQALITVGAMLSQHASLIRPSLDTLKTTLLACLHESLLPHSANPSLRSHVLRVFSGFLNTLENKKAKRYLGIVQHSQDIVIDITRRESVAFLSTDNNNELSMEWWSSFLESVVLCLRDNDDNVRASAAQCMSLMSESVQEQLVAPEARQEYYRLLLAMFKDTSVAVCCQAVWALGYWVAMRPLNVDLGFISLLVRACQDLAGAAIEDASVYVVCANATWSLSNAIEVLVAHKESLLLCCQTKDDQHKVCEQLVKHYLADTDCIRQLLALFCNLCSLKKAGQVAASARIHENAIRGLGYLCRFVDENLTKNKPIADQLLIASDTFCKAIQLADKAGRVKVKWNACLSASHICVNAALISDTSIFDLQSLVDCLMSTVASDRYFKVRNNALLSLLTLLDHGGRTALGHAPLDRWIRPLAVAGAAVRDQCSVPFSEVHRHCLCLYLLNYALIHAMLLLSPPDHDLIQLDHGLIQLLTHAINDQVTLIWQHVHDLNRSFNKHTLLTQTLMIQLPINGTMHEVDQLLIRLRATIDTWSPPLPPLPVITLYNDMHRALTSARLNYEQQQGIITSATPSALTGPATNLSDDDDDDGLLTKRPGASLIFSQIYD